MEITDIRIRKVEREGKMRGMASVTFDHSFVVHDIKIIEGEKGLFIAMPSRKAHDGEYRDIAHPINSATRECIQTAVLAAYRETVANSAETGGGYEEADENGIYESVPELEAEV